MRSFFAFIGKTLFILLLLGVITYCGIRTYNSFKFPSYNRDFEDASKILPDITIAAASSTTSSSMVTIKQLRDWRYKKSEIVSKEYYEETFDVNKVQKAHLLFNPFGKWEGIGHFFFVFEFSDGKSVSVSVEARKENGEDYSAVRGVFNEYELWYAFGSAADFMSRRAIYHDEELYSYPLAISTSSAQALFLDLSRSAEKLEGKPAFYNTVTSNCTNLLADSANRVKKGSIPFHVSRLFTGYADNQLYDLGFIKNAESFEEVYKKARIDELIQTDFGSSTDFTKEGFAKKYYFK